MISSFMIDLRDLQFAKAAGARVIATTRSESKAEIIRSLGADHIINYKAESDWGTVAARLSPDSLGVNYIVEVGGPQAWRSLSRSSELTVALA